MSVYQNEILCASWNCRRRLLKTFGFLTQYKHFEIWPGESHLAKITMADIHVSWKKPGTLAIRFRSGLNKSLRRIFFTFRGIAIDEIAQLLSVNRYNLTDVFACLQAYWNLFVSYTSFYTHTNSPHVVCVLLANPGFGDTTETTSIIADTTNNSDVFIFISGTKRLSSLQHETDGDLKC